MLDLSIYQMFSQSISKVSSKSYIFPNLKLDTPLIPMAGLVYNSIAWSWFTEITQVLLGRNYYIVCDENQIKTLIGWHHSLSYLHHDRVLIDIDLVCLKF